MAIPFEEISRAALTQADSLLASWFPRGRKIGREFKIGNLRGDPGDSLSINLDTGLWSDFATGERGGDLIDLRAASLNKELGEVARQLAADLNIHAPPQKTNGHSLNGHGKGWHPLIPPATTSCPRDLFAGFDVVYEYTDANDRVTHYVGRIEARGGERKRFVPITYGVLDGKRGWHRKSPSAPRPLYGLNRLAHAPDAPVLICEGEKAADAAQALFPDHACVSWSNGAESVDKADLSPLKGRRVIIWPDNDEPGQRAATYLRGKLPSASVLRVDDLDEGDDAADIGNLDDPAEWLQARLDKSKSRILSGAEFMATFVPPDYIIDGLVQRTRLYACTSKTGHGKTAVWLYLGCMVMTGRHVGNLETTQGDVIFLAGENPDDLCGRMHAACKEYGIPASKAPYVLPANFPMTPEAAAALKHDIDEMGLNPVLIIADTAAAYFPGDDDNNNVQMGEYGRTLRILTRCIGNPAVVALAHPVKNPDRDNLLPRGGGAFLNELDGNLTLWSDAQGESTTLHWQGKLRGSDFDPLPFVLRSTRVPGLVDAKNRPLVSVVAEAQSPEGAANVAKQAISDENAVLFWLQKQPGCSLASIAEEAGWVNERGQPMKAKVQRCLERLKADKLVKVHRRKWVITDAGKAELGKEKGP